MTSVLVLNSTYEAMGIVDVRRAVHLVFAGKADIVRNGERLRALQRRQGPSHAG